METSIITAVSLYFHCRRNEEYVNKVEKEIPWHQTFIKPEEKLMWTKDGQILCTTAYRLLNPLDPESEYAFGRIHGGQEFQLKSKDCYIIQTINLN